MIHPLLLLLALQSAVPAEPAFVAAHLTRTHTLQLAGPPRAVFPLFGPLGEKKWAGAHGWDPKFVYPQVARDEAGCVFTTGGQGSEAVWLLRVFDEQKLEVEYVQLIPGFRLTQLRIRLTPTSAGGTAAEIGYTWTGLSEKGNQYVEAHRGPNFDEEMAEWEATLNAYLKRAATQ